VTDPGDPAIVDEIRDALRTLVAETRATQARIVDTDDGAATDDTPTRTLALGGGEYLRVDLPRPDDADGTQAPVDIEAAFDRATRQLRAIRRRWEIARLPEVTVGDGSPRPMRDLVADRIVSYMQGLAAIDRGTNAFVIHKSKLVASARKPDEVETARWEFLARRVHATHAPGSSHGEIVDPDAYAMSFWYDAALVVLLAEPYAIDFVRHRCRQVARELANLLPLLEPDPDSPAAIRRRPPTLP